MSGDEAFLRALLTVFLMIGFPLLVLILVNAGRTFGPDDGHHQDPAGGR